MDNTRLWKTILSEVELLVTKPTYITFFAPTQLVSLSNSVATIGCNTNIAVNIMESRYYALLKNLLDKHTKTNNSLIFKIVATNKPSAAPGPLFSYSPGTTGFTSGQRGPQLRPDYIFDAFAVSSSNQMAYAAATAVAQSPGTTYNPLFLYGGVGVGKTHLMQAIGNHIYQKKAESRIIYCAGEEFTNEIVAAIQTKTTQKFKDKYRSAKLLLIDDVQFLEGKTKVQEEFFHTFNAVQKTGGQIVMTSDRPPHEITGLEERLLSRFEGGLLVDVQNPDFELRCAILRIKAQQKGLDLDINIAKILAANVESVRRLEGLLTLLITQSQVKKIPLSEDLARQIIGKPLSSQETKGKISVLPNQVVEVITKKFNISISQIKGDRRSRFLARPRQILMYLLRTELSLSLDEVGTWVGGRDHSTVIHAVDTISNLLSTNEKMRSDVEWIKHQLYG